MHLSSRHVAIGGLVVCGLVLTLGLPASAAKVTAKQAVARAIAATEAATSVHVAGQVVESNQTISIHVQATDQGVGQGTLGIGKGLVTLRSVGGTIYFMGTPAFWTANGGQSAAQLFAGKWVSTAATSSTGQSLAGFLNSTTFMKQVVGSKLNKSVFAFHGRAKVNGRLANVITGHDAHAKNGGRLYVAAKGTPYILRITTSGSEGKGSLTFSSFDQPVNPAVPSGAIDLDTFQGSSSG